MSDTDREEILQRRYDRGNVPLKRYRTLPMRPAINGGPDEEEQAPDGDGQETPAESASQGVDGAERLPGSTETTRKSECGG